MTKRKIILCGYNWIGCAVLDYLIKEKFEIFVYTHDNPSHINSLKDLCIKKSIPFSLEKCTIDNLPFIPEIICSIYYRYIIDKEIIKLVKGKIFNVHPSLLPAYRGCSSLTWAMINNEKNVGFTYHYITEGIDEGNIILQKKIEIQDWDTQITLYHRIMFEAFKQFANSFKKVCNGFLGYKQNSYAQYYKRGCPYAGQIDLTWDVNQIERFIRAMTYPPLPYAKIGNVEIKSFSEFLRFKAENGI